MDRGATVTLCKLKVQDHSWSLVPKSLHLWLATMLSHREDRGYHCSLFSLFLFSLVTEATELGHALGWANTGL